MAANKLIMVISTFYSSIYAFTRLEQMHATDGVSTREPKHLHGQRDTQVPSRWHKEASPFCWGPKETCKEGRSRLHDCSWRSIISTCFAKAPTQCTTFLSYKTHKCGTKWGHIVLVQILCAPSGRIWMDFTWWTKLGERNRQWEHVALCKYPCHQPSLLLKDYNYIMTFRKMVFESSYTEQSEGNIHNCR